MFGKLASALGDVLDGDDEEEIEVSEETTRAEGSGQRRALLVGINYTSHSTGVLNGCLNDVDNVKAFLVSRDYPEANMRILKDDDPNNMPTKANILAGMKWLAAGAAPGDSLFFHYSGHGTQMECEGGILESLSEGDGKDEAICPVDYQTAGMIRDNDMHDIMVKPLPAGVRFTAIFDSCHSGTALDLPFVYEAPEPEYADAHEAEGGGFFDRQNFNIGNVLRGGVAGLSVELGKVVSTEAVHHGSKYVKKSVGASTKASKADVFMFSGCRDEQTSADASFSGRASGAMSFAFISSMAGHPESNYTTLIKNMRDVLKKGTKKFTQMPQMSLGRNTNPDVPVVI